MNLPTILNIPPEVVLHIFSYLDLPELTTFVRAFPAFNELASDPVLHRHRLKVVAPSRVQHSLFGLSDKGIPLRPTVGDLVQRGVIRGLGIERRWRMGLYFYSRNSIIQYENGRRFARRHASDVISLQLRRRPLPADEYLSSLHASRVLPDIESSRIKVSRILLPIMHKLKWSLQRDRFARVVRLGLCGTHGSDGKVDFAAWLEKSGRAVVKDDDEKVRLALCPDVRKLIEHYENI